MSIRCKWFAIHDAGDTVGEYVLIKSGEAGLYSIEPKVPKHCRRCGYIWFYSPNSYSVSYYDSDAVPYDEAVAEVRRRLAERDEFYGSSIRPTEGSEV